MKCQQVRAVAHLPFSLKGFDFDFLKRNPPRKKPLNFPIFFH